MRWCLTWGLYQSLLGMTLNSFAFDRPTQWMNSWTLFSGHGGLPGHPLLVCFWRVFLVAALSANLWSVR